MENKCSTEENLKTLNLLILIIKTDNIFDDEASDSNIHLVVEVPVPAATSKCLVVEKVIAQPLIGKDYPNNPKNL
ncbi:4164_t:CDS:2 [Entrophospora sp. SA101]|nr:4164_t:CDS:2 [Entrophospora sp. SA101]